MKTTLTMTWRSSALLAAGFLASLFVLAGCGGGGSSRGPSLLPRPSPSPSASAVSDAEFQIQIPVPGSSAASLRVHPKYVSAATQSLRIALNGQTLATGDVSATSKNCADPAKGFRTCNVTVNAPAGTDAFAITAYDGPNGTGDVLSSGMVSQKISSSQQSVVAVVMDGTPVSMTLSLQNPNPPAGTEATSGVIVQMFDAQGSTILGSYTQPVTLKDADTTGATQLSGTTINASSAKPVTLSYSGVQFTSTIITATASNLPTQTVTFAATPSVVAEYRVPTVSSIFGPQPQGINAITLGPDGNMWMVADGHSALDKVSPTGAVTMYPLPSDGDGAESIAVGADHDLWFCESYNGTIGKMTTSGAVTEYAIPFNSNTEFSQPAVVIAGPDGNMWMLDQGLNALFKVTTSGNFTRFNLPRGPKHAPFYEALAFGPDGNVWLADGPDDDVVVISTSGSVVATYTFQHASFPQTMVVGPDKNMWIAEALGNRIARVTTSGKITEYNLPSGAAYPWQLIDGPDGNIWFAEYGFGNYGGPAGGLYGGGKFGYITPGGSTIRDFATNDKVDPQNDLHVVGLAFDPTGKLWLAQSAVNNIDMVETVIY